MLYNKDSVETSRTEMSEESQDTVESASPNRESLCSTMTPGIDAKINDVIKQNPAYGLNMLALGEMVSQRFLVPLFEVRVLEGQPTYIQGAGSSAVEQRPFKACVVGSIPTRLTKHGPFVYRLGHMVFIHKRGVRLP